MNFLILGKPNVGKTSIYNILSSNNKNIIHKTTGTTRDWHVSQLTNNLNIINKESFYKREVSQNVIQEFELLIK